MGLIIYEKSIYLITVYSLLSHPTTQIQELWIGYTSISPDNPQVGQIRVGGLTFSIILSNGQQNWIWTNVPSPNVERRAMENQICEAQNSYER